MKTVLYFLLAILSTANIKSSSNEGCNLKLAKTVTDLYHHGSAIFDSGHVDPQWEVNSDNLYNSEFYSTIEYFYLMEIKQSQHEDVVVRIYLLISIIFY